MSDVEQGTPAPAEQGAPVPAAAPRLWVERTGIRTYTGANSRGAQVLLGEGDSPGVFTPGELLQIALAGCVGQSADHRIGHALGQDFEGRVTVSVEKDKENNRYTTFSVSIDADMSGLDEATRRKTVERAVLAVERGCTVGRTIDAGAPHTITFTNGADA